MRFVLLLFVLAVTAAAQRPPVPGSTATCATGAEGDLLVLSCGTGSVTKVAFAEFGTGTVSGNSEYLLDSLPRTRRLPASYRPSTDCLRDYLHRVLRERNASGSKGGRVSKTIVTCTTVNELRARMFRQPLRAPLSLATEVCTSLEQGRRETA
jgi:hypothetical protein